MKKTLLLLFAWVALCGLALTSCGDDGYSIDEAYEKAEITGIVLYDRSSEVASDRVTIDSDAATVTVILKEGADITDLKMVATISSGATLTPGMAVGFRDYSAPGTYTVTSPGGTVVKEWTITVQPAGNQ